MINLAAVHGERVAVELSINGRFTSLQGVASYVDDAALGKVLRIRFSDEAGGMEILLEESKWAGRIDRAAEGEPYTIKLDATTASETSPG